MYRKQTWIPTLVALAILLFGIGGGIFLVETSQPLDSLAESSIVPSSVRITNVSDSTLTVSWLTAKETTGYVSYRAKTGGAQLTAFDDRDMDGKAKNYVTHHVTLRNLRENSTYSFKIFSGGSSFGNEGNAYTQSTGPALADTTTLPPVYGVILSENEKPATGAIVYLTVGKSQPLSTLTKTSGTWLIPLNNLRSQDLFTRPVLSDSEIIQIQAIFSKTLQLSATTDTNNDSPVPTMTLGKKYDFRNIQSKTLIAKDSGEKKILGSTTSDISPSPTLKKILDKVDFTFPKRDGDTTSDTRPTIRGVGIPSKDVVLILNSNPQQTGKTTIGSDGTWSYRFNSLPPSKVTVNITTQDGNGKSVSLSRSFIVLKSGEQVLGESTPSATLIPTETIPSHTTPFEFPTATPTTPVTGNSAPTYGFLVGGILLVVAGIKFLLF